MPDAAREIRRLLLSGDNILKNRDGAAARQKARERFERARSLAADLDDEALKGIISARLEALGATEEP